jgi:hypothetical protein
MGTLEQALQELHEAGRHVEISWLWDGGVDVNAEGEKRNFRSVPEVLRWLQHWYGLKPREASPDALETELQKIYDSASLAPEGDPRKLLEHLNIKELRIGT